MNIPKNLIRRFMQLSDDFENAIRASERQRIAAKFAMPLAAGLTAEEPASKPEPLYPITDMHGEPLHVTPQQRTKLPRSLQRVLHIMETRKYPVTAATMARECGTTKGAILKRLSDLRQRGYVIEKGRTTRFRIVNYKLAGNQ